MEFYVMAGIAGYFIYKSISPREPPKERPNTGTAQFTPAFYSDPWIEKQNKEALMPGMKGRTLLRRRPPK